MSGWFRRHRAEYPADWDAIAAHIKALAGWRCEACDAPHSAAAVLAVHHVDGDPSVSADSNLVALCSRCHLRAHTLRPRPLDKAETIKRLRRHWEIAIGQLCFALTTEAT